MVRVLVSSQEHTQEFSFPFVGLVGYQGLLVGEELGPKLTKPFMRRIYVKMFAKILTETMNKQFCGYLDEYNFVMLLRGRRWNDGSPRPRNLWLWRRNVDIHLGTRAHSMF